VLRGVQTHSIVEVAKAVPHHSIIEPGHFVRHPQQPDWGVGQVQSVIDDRITVNFEHAGKVLVNARVINLAVLHDLERGS
jgi:transcription elongation factor GreA-like protein